MTHRRKHFSFAILLVLISSCCFVTAWSFIKEIGQRLPTVEVVFFRALFSLILLAPLVHFRARTFRAGQFGLLFARSIFGLGSMLMGFYVFSVMEIGNATALLQTLPVFVALLAPLLTNEPFYRRNLAAIVVAFVGVLFILKPTADIFNNAAIFAVGSGLLAAISMIYVRQLHRTNTTYTIIFYFTAFVAIATLPPMLIDYIPPTREEWMWLVGIGVMVTVAQLAVTKAYQLAEAALIAPFGYSAVILSYIAGLVVWGEKPDLPSTIGAGLIVAAGTAITWLSRKHPFVPGTTPGVRI